VLQIAKPNVRDFSHTHAQKRLQRSGAEIPEGAKGRHAAYKSGVALGTQLRNKASASGPLK